MCKLNVALGCLAGCRRTFSAGTAQADLITNGDFTAGGDTWVGGSPGADAWTTSGTVYVETGYGSPPEYGNVAVTGNGGSFTQQIGTVAAGQTYNISYDLGGGTGGVAGLYYNDGSSWVPLASNTATTTSNWGTYHVGFDAVTGQPYVGQPLAARFKPAGGWACAITLALTPRIRIRGSSQTVVLPQVRRDGQLWVVE